MLWDFERRQLLHEQVLGNNLDMRVAFAPGGGRLAASDFGIHIFQLEGEAKDAENLAALLAGGSEAYGEVRVRQVLDGEATRENILALREFLMESKVDDQVMVFLAGHGLLDDELDYYFATTDVDFADPSARGLAYDELEGLVDGIAARLGGNGHLLGQRRGVCLRVARVEERGVHLCDSGGAAVGRGRRRQQRRGARLRAARLCGGPGARSDPGQADAHGPARESGG